MKASEDYNSSGTMSSKNTYLGHAMNVVNSRYRYCKKEQDVSPWVVIQDTPEAVEQAIRKGAMFISTPALSAPFDAQNHDAEIMRFDDLVLDFDDKANPGNAIRELLVLIGHIAEQYGIDPYCMRFWCSGGKGFHATIPAECFGSQDGDVYLPLIYKKMVCQWAASLELPTIDVSMYCTSRGKMLRIAGVMRDNGHCKVPLTLDELQLPIDKLWKLSESPREVEPVDADTACEDLAGLYQECKKQVHAEIEEQKNQPPVDPELMARMSGQLSPCMAYILTANPKTDKTTFNKFVVTIVKFMLGAGFAHDEAIVTCRKFLDTYPHSGTYLTPQARIEHFTAMWRYLSGRHDNQFLCSYVLGMGLPGKGFECRECQLKCEPSSGAEKKKMQFIHSPCQQSFQQNILNLSGIYSDFYPEAIL